MAANVTVQNIQPVSDMAIAAAPAPAGLVEIPALDPATTTATLALLKITAKAQAYNDLLHPIGHLVNPEGLNAAELLQTRPGGIYTLKYGNVTIFASPVNNYEAYVVPNAVVAKIPTIIGNPTSDPTPCKGGFYTTFSRLGGRIYTATGSNTPFVVYGDIMTKYLSLGAEGGFLGLPTLDETSTPNRRGRFNHFQGGSIYWTAKHGACFVGGAIREKWAQLGWEARFLGFPLTDEMTTPDGRGRYNHFEGGSIYWTPETGAHSISGAIKERYSSIGWEDSVLGYPTTDELSIDDNRGRFNHFERGSIYWTLERGAWHTFGAIGHKYREMGYERSILGYPISKEEPCGKFGSRYQDFEGGWMFWSHRTNIVTVMHGAVPTHLEWYNEHTFRSGVSVGGHSYVTIHSDGKVERHGCLHNSGAVMWDYSIGYVVLDADNVAHSFSKSGQSWITPRDDRWKREEWSYHNELVKEQWRAIVAGGQHMRCHAHVSTNADQNLDGILSGIGKVFETVGEVIEEIAKAAGELDLSANPYISSHGGALIDGRIVPIWSASL